MTVLDETAAVLPGATVVLTGPDGRVQTLAADERGVAATADLAPGTYEVRATMEAFRPTIQTVTVRRGANQVTITLPLAIQEEVTVNEVDAAGRRDNGFTTTLTPEEIEGLSDDPDEMAEQLAQMAGPGAQIFVDGFRGGRLPPKDQIQQVRFRTNSYAAEYHDAGMVRVEVITKPGMGNWRSRANFGFRDESMNGTNAFADERAPEQVKRWQVNSQGPIVKGKTSVSFSVEGNDSYDSQTIVATIPDGEVRGQMRRPNDVVNATIRVEQALGAGNALRAEYQRRTQDRRNLGVGDFELPERAYRTDAVTDTLRLRNTRVISKIDVLGAQVRVRADRAPRTPRSRHDPTVRVLDAFTGGGAGQSGVRDGRQFVVDGSLDFTVRKHALRTGLLFEAGQWDSTQQTNANGTYTFSTLDDFEAGLARQYSRRFGDPLVSYSQYQAGWYLQDDFRLQQEPAGEPRAAPGAADPRRRQLEPGAAGRLHLDGRQDQRPRRLGHLLRLVRQRHLRADAAARRHAPDRRGRPRPDLSALVHRRRHGAAAERDPRGRQLDQPMVQQASIGFDKNLTPTIGMRADYMWTRGYRMLRSVNVNAPVDGVRPDPSLGNISELSSTGRRAQDRLTVGLNMRVPNRRIFAQPDVPVRQHPQLRRLVAEPAGQFDCDPDADWGPSAQDIRHRAVRDGQLSAALQHARRPQHAAGSARPYNITTGSDDNGDTVFNDRPADVSRNSARGALQFTTDLRLTKSINLGGLLGGGPEGVPMGSAPPPPPRWRRGDAAWPGRRSWWRRRRRPADGDHGRLELALPARPLRERAEPLQPHQLQHLRRQPAVAVLRHRDVGDAGPPARGRRHGLVLRLGTRGWGLGTRA